MQLNGKRVVLTGATGGVGSLIAKLLAEKGASLALVGRSADKLNLLKNSLTNKNESHVIIVADFEQINAAQNVIDAANQQLGSIDILINNAGILDFTWLENQSEVRIAHMVQTNVTTLIQLTRAVLPQFKAQNHGHYVMIGSIFGSLGFPHFATYCATKFAVHGFSQALRRELFGSNIGVTYIAPRAINTPMMDDKTANMMKASGNAMDAPEKVAAMIVNALEKEKQELFIGQPQTFFAWLNGIAPKIVNLGLKSQVKIASPFLKDKH